MSKKFLFYSISCILFLASCVTRTSDPYSYTGPGYVGLGVGLGTIIAVVVSWSRNKSILWAIIHGILGWIYVIYALLVRNK